MDEDHASTSVARTGSIGPRPLLFNGGRTADLQNRSTGSGFLGGICDFGCREIDLETFMRRTRSWKRGPGRKDYFSFAYSALASFRMGMSGSASFQSVRKS
jgi:hypothetical protein